MLNTENEYDCFLKALSSFNLFILFLFFKKKLNDNKVSN